MRIFLLLSLLPILLCGGQESELQDFQNHQDGFSTKVFYRKHIEGKYKYTTKGVEIDWIRDNPTGLNYNLSFLTNPGSKKLFFETDTKIFYKIKSTNYLTFFPILGSKMTLHSMVSNYPESHSNYKYSLYGGGGIETFFLGVKPRVEIILFQDIGNFIFFKQDHFVWTKSARTQRGERFTVAIVKEFKKNNYFEIRADYTMAHPNAYSQLHSTFGIILKF